MHCSRGQNTRPEEEEECNALAGWAEIVCTWKLEERSSCDVVSWRKKFFFVGASHSHDMIDELHAVYHLDLVPEFLTFLYINRSSCGLFALILVGSL